MTPAVAALVDAARDAAWHSHCNLSSVRLYAERNGAWERLRDAVAALGFRPIGGPPQLMALVDQARRLAYCTAANVLGERYYERKRVMAELRGCLDQFDAVEGRPIAMWPRGRTRRAA